MSKITLADLNRRLTELEERENLDAAVVRDAIRRLDALEARKGGEPSRAPQARGIMLCDNTPGDIIAREFFRWLGMDGARHLRNMVNRAVKVDPTLEDRTTVQPPSPPSAPATESVGERVAAKALQWDTMYHATSVHRPDGAGVICTGQSTLENGGRKYLADLIDSAVGKTAGVEEIRQAMVNGAVTSQDHYTSLALAIDKHFAVSRREVGP